MKFKCFGSKDLVFGGKSRSPIEKRRFGGGTSPRECLSYPSSRDTPRLASPRTSQHEEVSHASAKDLNLADYAGDMGVTRGASFQLKSPFLTYGAFAILITIVIVAYQGQLLTRVHTYLGE